MDERLKGRIILIGKEPGQGRLVVSVSGVSKVASLGTIGSVPNCVSRWKDGTAHCQIAISHDGVLTIKNLKDANVTYVNGTPVVSKRVEVNSQVELGKDRYAININMILQAAATLLPKVAPPPPPVKEYSIKHLERVWNKYHDGTIEIRKRNQSLAASQSFTPILTLGSGAISAIAAPFEFGMFIWPVTIPLTLLGVGLMARNYYKRKNDNSIEEGERLGEEFMSQYVCPNPDCGQFMGNLPYDVIKKKKSCPYCKCKYNEQ